MAVCGNPGYRLVALGRNRSDRVSSNGNALIIKKDGPDRRDLLLIGTGAAAVSLLGPVSFVRSAAAQTQPVASALPGYPPRYMGEEARLTTAPNGAVIYDRALEAGTKTAYIEKTVEKVTDGVWVIGGYSLVNCTVIEAPDGLIVYDTGDSAEEGQHFREAIETKISKRPIKAIIYSHSHYALGGGAMVDDPKSVMVIGHPKLNETIKANLEGGGAPSVIPELGPVLTARAVVQFNNFLPLEGADAAVGARIELKPPAFLPVDTLVEDGQTLNVAGLDLQFFTKYISDDFCVTVLVPGKKAVLNNFVWAGTPNLYTLRGAVYRDPQEFRNGLKAIRDLQPAYLLNTHARAISGSERAFEALTNYMDLITLTYDQTLRGILHGLKPDELRYFIYKPRHLADDPNNAETYGETVWYPQAVYYHQLGWYDREPATLFQLPPQDAARRLIDLMGGPGKVRDAAKQALAKKEYAWAAELVNYVYVANPNDREARQIKADALRKMGQLAFGSIGRAFLISEARALEGTEQIPRLVPPNAAVIAANPTAFVNYFRVRIDPQKAEQTDKMIAFTFGDKTVALDIRRGIAEYVDDLAKYYRKPNFTLAMDGTAWAKLYLNQTDLAQSLNSAEVKITQGDQSGAAAILDLFDKFQPVANLTVPTAPRDD
jgi:alkyl sulfatase BDS1-like metallo-beta-lactamase superfamily hydrolase